MHDWPALLVVDDPAAKIELPMPRRKIHFDTVWQIAGAMPDVEKVVSARGSGLKVRGKLLACPAMHSTAEPNTLMVRVSFDERARLLAAAPETYYVTDHYLKYPAVLVRLSRISRAALRNLLGIGWLFVSAKTGQRNRPARSDTKRR